MPNSTPTTRRRMFNVVTRTVAITAMVGTAVGAAGAAQAEQVRSAGAASEVPIVRLDRVFASCRAAQEYYSKGAPPGRAKLEYEAKTTKPVTRYLGDDFSVWTAKAQLTMELDTSRSRIIMDVISWKHMTRADKAAAQHLDAALLAHEEGHVKWEDVVLKKWKDFTVHGVGATEQEAINELLVKEVKYEQEIRRELDAMAKIYDIKTSNGLTQDTIGGENTTLKCR